MAGAARTAETPRRGEQVAVMGLGISNVSLVKYLANRGATPVVFDRRTPDQLAHRWEEARSLADEGCLGEAYLHEFERRAARGEFAWVFVTPGMNKNLPQLSTARRAGARLSSEMGLFMSLCPAPMLGVTGSAGKSTTTALLGTIMSAWRRQTWVGGNIGRPLIQHVDEIRGQDPVVLELSSFQLEMAERVPSYGAILNISPNHLDLHGDMKAYVEAKAVLVTNQCEKDHILLNRDCPHCRALAGRARGRAHFFSARDGQRSEDTLAWRQGGRLFLAGGNSGAEMEICRVEDIPLRGEHNVGNVLAACGLAHLAGVPPVAMRSALFSFTPLEHRLQEAGTVDGVLYINDSIATAPDRTEAALASFDRPVVLILGGYDKGLPFDGLAESIVRLDQEGRIRGIVRTGATRETIGRALDAAFLRAGGEQPGSGARRSEDLATAGFEDAVEEARRLARPGDVVLMSPACASFDQFANFAERGRVFCSMVRSWQRDESCRPGEA